jgi:hypothetical protein
MVAKSLKAKKAYDIHSRGFPHFGHGFGQYAREIAKALGMPREAGQTVKVYTTFDAPGVWMSWVGSNGERYRHKFESEPANMSDEEFSALRVKVRLSTC